MCEVHIFNRPRLINPWRSCTNYSQWTTFLVYSSSKINKVFKFSTMHGNRPKKLLIYGKCWKAAPNDSKIMHLLTFTLYYMYNIRILWLYLHCYINNTLFFSFIFFNKTHFKTTHLSSAKIHSHTYLQHNVSLQSFFFFFLFSREGEVKCLVMMGSIDEMALTSLVKVNALSSNSKVTKLVIKTNIGWWQIKKAYKKSRGFLQTVKRHLMAPTHIASYYTI